jgi:hypothetical protein
MSVAGDLLKDLAGIGATIEPAGDRLILRAGPSAIPATLVRRVREAKADLLASLAPGANRDGLWDDEVKERDANPPRREAKVRTLESGVVEWLSQHPAPSEPGRCAWCGKPESPDAVVLPFGTEPGSHTWLHSDCWHAWHRARRAEAAAELRGIVVPPG